MRADAHPHPHLLRPELAILCRRFHVEQLDAFGSSVRRDFDAKSSDLDFLVRFERLPPAQYAANYFGLLDSLKQLFGYEIDLVTDASLANPYFRARIDSERQTLFAQ